MADRDFRRASAHVERGNSRFDLAGLGGGIGANAGGVGVGVGAGNIAATPERRRSTSFLHGPEMVASDEDNELFMSDEFRMYCYKVRIGALVFLARPRHLKRNVAPARNFFFRRFSLPRPGSRRTSQGSDPRTMGSVDPRAARSVF